MKKYLISRLVTPLSVGLTCVCLSLSANVHAVKPDGGTDNSMIVSETAIGDGLNPGDPAWSNTPASVFDLKHLDAQDTACGYTDGYEERLLQVKGVHDGTHIYFRFEWDDPNESVLVNDTNKYADGIALQIPLGAEGNRNTTIQMGSQNNPVNILFWRADLERPQNIVAGGIGTVQESPDSQNLVQSQSWENGRWTVIIGRTMNAASDNQVQFTSGGSYGAVFGNWEGGDFERNGHKAISGWINMDLE